MWLLPIASFSSIYILQGSVATQLRCGEIFNNQFIANYPMSVPVKELWKSDNISWGYRKKKCDVILGHSVHGSNNASFLDV